jgi:hypothetical protein
VGSERVKSPPRGTPGDAAPGTGPSFGRRGTFFVRMGTLAAFAAGLAAYVVISWHWPLIYDMTVMHYVSFLIDKGWAPYRQIGDMNMPGAYLFEGWALHLFGSSDVGWRLYDFSLSAVTIGAMISIARRYDWLAGLVAGGTFALVHASEGPRNAGQRDQVMAVLLVTGYAFCFEAVRRHRAWLMLPAAFAMAMAASVKPTLVLAGPVLLVLVVLELRRQGARWGGSVGYTVAGFVLAGAIVVGFLVEHQSMHAFVYDLTTMIPSYAGVLPTPWPTMLRLTLQIPMWVYIGCGVVVATLDRTWKDWEFRALLVGVLLGLISFYGQRKGFGQHRYTAVAFALLWVTIQMFLALRRPGVARYVAVTALAFVVLVNIPRDLQWTYRQTRVDPFSTYLERDLGEIGTGRLQGQVQCLDIIDGCLNALYHLKIVQSSGSTGDILYFLPERTPVIDRVRAEFLGEMERQRPDFIVMSNLTFKGARSFEKVRQWPEFAGFLEQNYRVVVQREFGEGLPTSHLGMDSDVLGYRIYARRGVSVPFPEMADGSAGRERLIAYNR